MAVIVLSGQKSVTTAGTAVALTTGANLVIPGVYQIKALPANTGVVYLGNDGAGDVTSSNGMPLSAGDSAVLTVTDLNQLYIDATADAQGVGWLRVAGMNVGIDPPAA